MGGAYLRVMSDVGFLESVHPKDTRTESYFLMQILCHSDTAVGKTFLPDYSG